MKEIAIIGGGASGLMSAVSAARAGAAPVIYERNPRVGKKILATGNGRCNMTNLYADVKHYHGADPGFIKGAKNRFWVKETLDFFRELGVVPREEAGGKVYPYSSQASAVLDALRFETERLGIETVTGFEVKQLRREKRGFSIEAYDGRRETAGKVILAAGGKAAPDTGSNGGGYALAKSLGHSVSALYPSLVQIKTEPGLVRAMKGIKVEAAVCVLDHKETGEVLFTEYGFSGPPVFSISNQVLRREARSLSLDLMPEYKREEVAAILKQRLSLETTLENFFVGLFHKRVGMQLMKAAGTGPLTRTVSTLSRRELADLVEKIKGWEFPITGTQSWNNAQVTAGGVLTAGIDPVTFASKKMPGLYLTGEILDIDGDCGGYNLQWAWSSGYLAGWAAALQK